MTVFWGVAPSNLLEIDGHFRETYCLRSPWWWRQTLLKRRSFSTRLHGRTSQNTVIFILAAVRTWKIRLSFVLFTKYDLSYQIKEDRIGGARIYICRWQMYSRLKLKILKGTDHLQDIDSRCRWYDNTKCTLWKQSVKMLNGYIELRTWASGGLLWAWQWTFGCHKLRGIPWTAERPFSKTDATPRSYSVSQYYCLR
jgi:hypothetical protein